MTVSTIKEHLSDLSKLAKTGAQYYPALAKIDKVDEDLKHFIVAKALDLLNVKTDEALGTENKWTNIEA